MNKWVAYDGSDFNFFDTKDEAESWAADSLREYRDMAPDGWPEEVEQIFVARVVTAITVTERHPVEPGDQCQGCDEYVDYALVPSEQQ